MPVCTREMNKILESPKSFLGRKIPTADFILVRAVGGGRVFQTNLISIYHGHLHTWLITLKNLGERSIQWGKELFLAFLKNN